MFKFVKNLEGFFVIIKLHKYDKIIWTYRKKPVLLSTTSYISIAHVIIILKVPL